MTQEDKQLLIKDLCARLPYGVKLNVPHYYGDEDAITTLDAFWLYDIQHGRKEIKPYLRSMLSMTEEEEKIFYDFLDFQAEYVSDADLDNKTDMYDWLNEHHFDYRGLIEKGLTLEAPEGMYK